MLRPEPLDFLLDRIRLRAAIVHPGAAVRAEVLHRVKVAIEL